MEHRETQRVLGRETQRVLHTRPGELSLRTLESWPESLPGCISTPFHSSLHLPVSISPPILLCDSHLSQEDGVKEEEAPVGEALAPHYQAKV